MIRNAVRSLWAQPRSPDPPRRVWRDWVLLALVLVSAAAEGIWRPDVIWRPLVIPLTMALAVPLLWRRTHPLTAVAVVFGSVLVFNLVALANGQDSSVGLYSMVFVLVLPYALLRWGSGREIVLGGVLILATWLTAVLTTPESPGDAVGGLIVSAFPALLGALVRSGVTSRQRSLEQVRLREREQLARDLHDTVAHHVSAIVIRAQAGKVVAASRPTAAVDALDVIETEGLRTLTEMRALVAALREAEDVELSPHAGVADLPRLAAASGESGPEITVTVAGQLDDLLPSVNAALYRIAQESITNALRHARHATRVTVHVVGEADRVRLTIRDDGEAGAVSRGTPGWGVGYGIVGMTERAALLGGTLTAGPCPDGGWLVDALLPRSWAPR